jgi:exodeoxyribonuclease VII large subunit
MLESLSFERVLERGYAMIEDAGGKPVSAAGSLEVGDRVTARFADGGVAMDVASEGAPKAQPKPVKPKKPKAKQKGVDERQGSLL